MEFIKSTTSNTEERNRDKEGNIKSSWYSSGVVCSTFWGSINRPPSGGVSSVPPKESNLIIYYLFICVFISEKKNPFLSFFPSFFLSFFICSLSYLEKDKKKEAQQNGCILETQTELIWPRSLEWEEGEQQNELFGMGFCLERAP